jgi:hypothetical protein
MSENDAEYEHTTKADDEMGIKLLPLLRPDALSDSIG